MCCFVSRAMTRWAGTRLLANADVGVDGGLPKLGERLDAACAGTGSVRLAQVAPLPGRDGDTARVGHFDEFAR
jgi:hypothetical protein